MSERVAARAAKRRKRLWFNFVSWATTVAIVVAAGALVHWRATSVLREGRRQKQADAAFDRAMRLWSESPNDLDAAAARFRAVVAGYPDTEGARKAAEELARIEEARAAGTRFAPPTPAPK